MSFEISEGEHPGTGCCRAPGSDRPDEFRYSFEEMAARIWGPEVKSIERVRAQGALQMYRVMAKEMAGDKTA